MMRNPPPSPETAPHTYTAFAGDARIAAGSLIDVAEAVKRRYGKDSHGDARIFSDVTGNAVDVNFHGSLKDVLKRLEIFQAGTLGTPSGPGRPRLGVVSREISLLPSQWEWLAAQPGGASTTLRSLVDEAKRKAAVSPSAAHLQERVYRFLSVAAGDFPGYEEALRALYRKDKTKFLSRLAAWPPDVRSYAEYLALPLFPSP